MELRRRRRQDHRTPEGDGTEQDRGVGTDGLAEKEALDSPPSNVIRPVEPDVQGALSAVAARQDAAVVVEQDAAVAEQDRGIEAPDVVGMLRQAAGTIRAAEESLELPVQGGPAADPDASRAGESLILTLQGARALLEVATVAIQPGTALHSPATPVQPGTGEPGTFRYLR